MAGLGMGAGGLRQGLSRALVRVERAVRSARWAVSPPRRLGLDPPTPRPASAPPPTQVVRRYRNVDTYNSHPGHGVTAEGVVSVYRAAERGVPWRQFDLFDDVVEVDGHLRGLVEGRILSVAGKTWVLQPGADDPGSRKAAADLEAQVRRAGLDEWLEHQLTGIFYGVAASETVWDIVDGMTAPVRFIHVAHRRLGAPSFTHVDEIGLVAPGGAVGAARQKDIPGGGVPPQLGIVALSEFPGRFAVTCNRARNPWAGGLLRTAAWWAVFKRWSVRDWQVFAEMFGLPIRLGYYQEGASEASRQVLAEAVEAIGSDGWAVLSDMTELVIKESARSGNSAGVYDAICNLCEEQMSKLIVGGTLSTDSGGNGSYAQASVHETRGYNLALADAKRVSSTFARDIGEPFIAWNRYGGAAPPTLRIQVVRETSLSERATQISTLATAFPDLEFDQDQVREDFALRAPAPGRGIKGPQKPPAAPPGAPPGAGNG